jgi:hypothetical protein
MTVLGHAQSAATYLDVARIWHDHAFEAGYAIEARDRKKLDQLLAELSANADILRLKILRS